jgi:SAM-dependent methyltransferase
MGADGTVYDHRFTPAQEAGKELAWREITRHLQRYVPADAVVLDIGADRGYFIRNVRARERWASDLRDTSHHLPGDVRFVASNGLLLEEHLPRGYFDLVFMSNYLEHLASPDEVIEQLRVVGRLLKPGGRVLVMQPNIRLVGHAYWDYLDHRVALTERSLAEAAAVAGFRTLTLITRFLPYTFRGRLPATPLLVRAYLSFPPVWRLMGKQTLFVGQLR